MKTMAEIFRSRGAHWVGDGFPVRSLFGYQGDSKAISPFLLFDYAGPYEFEPGTAPRGVGRASPSRVRNGDHRLRRRGLASRLRRWWRNDRAGRRAVDDGCGRHSPRGVPLARFHANGRPVSHGPALGEPSRQGQDVGARISGDQGCRHPRRRPGGWRGARAGHRRRSQRDAGAGGHVHAPSTCGTYGWRPARSRHCRCLPVTTR